ncbi:hypothetical protein [Rivularia sp. UHCC 0363]|uniref:hypothetical protein n=1 Tax=Rivularia sp. UHCC 0363 TaxID=3110244 RepID=UPI002B212C93|nr:hypothetical protein [Rivularia sp. UHCC 0363]MEA5593426.1 hypothetical protein [Rivularia sp. UHCC 0363]
MISSKITIFSITRFQDAAIYILGERQPTQEAASIEPISPQIRLMHLINWGSLGKDIGYALSLEKINKNRAIY